MNDVDFIRSFDKNIVTYYENAKNYCNDTPTHSLIVLRSFIVNFLELYSKKHKIDLQKTYLYKKIEQLSIVKKINKEIISILHQIRVDSNQAAHFEKSNLSLDDFTDLAKENLKRACNIVELAYQDITSNEIPNYTYEDFNINITKQICYEAIMNNDVHSQYIIGLNLQAKAKLEHLKEYNELKNSGQRYIYDPNSLKLLEQSSHWFKQASMQLEHADAIYEYAMALLYGEGVEQNIQEGEELIAISAHKDCTNAKAILGAFYLEGSKLYEQNYNKALHYLEDAASEEHPEALTNLSYMYKDAIGVNQNLEKSFEYMEKAANAGYMYAQYHLSNFYFNAIGVEKNLDTAMKWLNKSLEKDYPLAILTKARLLLEGTVLEKDLTLSRNLYIKYIELENDYNVLLEYANNQFEGLFGEIEYEDILNILENNFQNCTDDEIILNVYTLKNKIQSKLSKTNN